MLSSLASPTTGYYPSKNRCRRAIPRRESVQVCLQCFSSTQSSTLTLTSLKGRKRIKSLRLSLGNQTNAPTRRRFANGRDLLILCTVSMRAATSETYIARILPKGVVWWNCSTAEHVKHVSVCYHVQTSSTRAAL